MDQVTFARRFRDLRGEAGSFTVEATLVFPILLILSLALLLMPLLLYTQVDTQQVTSRVVLEASEAWVDRADALLAGESTWLREEGLYWRWTPSESDEALVNAEASVPRRFVGGLELQRGFLFSSIEGHYQSEFLFPPIWRQQPIQTAGRAEAEITDPVEWLRTLDSVQVYGKVLQRRLVTRKQAESALQRFFDATSPEAFASHNQAASYLRKLVSGSSKSLPTPHGLRKLDAMSATGTLHQAYLTFTVKGLREQMVKDAYLIQQGEPVQAVIWHFFRKKGQQGRVGPSPAFLRELEQQGITVVIHD